MKKLYKTDYDGLARDPKTRALVQTDQDALRMYKEKKKQANRVTNLESRLDRVEYLLTEISKKLDNK